jgi:hypothetical protein
MLSEGPSVSEVSYWTREMYAGPIERAAER